MIIGPFLCPKMDIKLIINCKSAHWFDTPRYFTHRVCVIIPGFIHGWMWQWQWVKHTDPHIPWEPNAYLILNWMLHCARKKGLYSHTHTLQCPQLSILLEYWRASAYLFRHLIFHQWQRFSLFIIMIWKKPKWPFWFTIMVTGRAWTYALRYRSYLGHIVWAIC